MAFCEIIPSDESRWMGVIDENKVRDIWSYLAGGRPSEDVVDVVKIQDGKILDFSNMPLAGHLVSRKFMRFVLRFGSDLARFTPVRSTVSGLYVMQPMHVLDAIDLARSDVEFFPDDHRYRPGKIRSIRRLVLDMRGRSTLALFALSRWKSAIFCSSTFRDACIDVDISGVNFRSVEEAA